MLTTLKRRWRIFEGIRDSILATVPEKMFGEASRARSVREDDDKSP